MQHEEADQTHAVERYLLGDMTLPEVEQFEEHLFGCPECADSVKAGAVFVENTRAVFQEPAEEGASEPVRRALEWKPAPWWKRFMAPILVPALAILALVSFAGYQQLVVIHGLRTQLAEVTAPQTLPSFALHAATRGGLQPIVVPASSHFFNLYFDVAVESASGYSCTIQDESGSIKFREHLPPPRPEAGGTINLLIGRSVLAEGYYIMIVSAESPGMAEIGRYPFRVEFK
jgi:hypothetical protein